MRTIRRTYRAKGAVQAREYRYEMVQAPVTARTKERLKERARREGKTMAYLLRKYVQRGLASL